MQDEPFLCQFKKKGGVGGEGRLIKKKKQTLAE